MSENRVTTQTISPFDPQLSLGSKRSAPRVFLMTDSFETGGSERQFAALAGSLDESSFRVQLGCISRRGAFLDGLGEVAEFPLGGSLYGLRSLQTRARLARHLQRERICIAHAFDFYTNLTMIPAARLARIPVVIGSQRQIGDLLTPAKSRAQLTALRFCDRIVCNSRAAANRLISQGIGENRLSVIPNGLPPSSFLPTLPALSRRSEVLRVGMIARMNTTSKNHHLFLRAAARLTNRFSKLEFILAGDGPLRPQLERDAIELHISDRVHFLGDRRDISAILASLDVSVLPSDSESLSNVILESMAAGVPVVATSVGGNPELITDNRGVLFPRGDEDSLVAEIERLLGEPARRTELSRNARQFAERHFTIGEMRQRHEDLYAELLEEKLRYKDRGVRAQKNPMSHPRLRVAIVAPSLRYVGGQSVQADALLSNLQNDPAIETHFIPIDPTFPPGLRWVDNVPFLRTMLREPIYLWKLGRGLRNLEIAHIFSASYWSFLIAPLPAWVLAKAFGVKTLVHYHSGEARDHLKRFRSARPILRRADRLVVPSSHLANVFNEFGLQARIVPNVVDLSQFSFRARNPLRPHLICTRGFHPYYRVDLVVRAFAQVKQAYPEARLDLLGRGPLEREIRNLIRNLQLTEVRFHGIASRKTIPAFYQRADIFINASVLDNMPVSVLEAFASGTPVVSTAPEGMRYLIDHERTGLLSGTDDPTALARNVIRLLQDIALSSRLSHNARLECTRYDWSQVRGQWLELYQSMLRPRQRAGAIHGI